MSLFIGSACDRATNADGQSESILSVGPQGETPPTPAESQSRSHPAFFFPISLVRCPVCDHDVDQSGNCQCL
jgi:hypothetical protein